MCQSIAEGGRRCSGTPTGKVLYALYRERRANPSEEINSRIANVKEAEKLYGGRFVTPFEMALPEGVSEAMDVARSVGNPLVVGGAVRDALCGAGSKDTDIEVYGTSLDELTRAYRKAGYSVDEVGKAFGVLKVGRKGGVRDLDVAVPRTENAVGKGHRDFTVDTDKDLTVTDAAQRRDFTINAMSYDPRLGVLIDPYGGKEDMERGVLRAVSEKFAEDPLRVMRGVQFAARFGMELDPETASMCRNLRPHASELARERVEDEWMKLWVKGKKPSLGLRTLREVGWDDIIPGLKDALTDDVIKKMDGLPDVPAEDRAATGAAILARNLPKYPQNVRRTFLGRVTVGNGVALKAANFADADPSELNTPYARKRWADTVSKVCTFAQYRRYAEIIGDAAAVAVCDAAEKDGVLNGPEPAYVLGRDIISGTDRKPGPWVGQIVEEAKERQYRGEFADRDAALEWAREHAAG